MVLLAANMHEKAVSCSFNNNGLWKKGNMDFEKIEKETTVNVSYEQILWRLGMNDEKVWRVWTTTDACLFLCIASKVSTAGIVVNVQI